MLSQQANKETSAMTHVSGRILPDDITVNGATVRGQCQLDDSGETVIFFYQVKSEQAKQRWLTIRQPVHLTGQGSMKRLLPATNFNQFDAQDFYATQHITHQITLSQCTVTPVSYTHLRAHETDSYLVCRLLLEKKKKTN